MNILNTRASTSQIIPFTGISTMMWLSVMILLWGLSWPATKLALHTVPPLWLAVIRFGSAALCLFIFTAFRGTLKFPTKSDWPIIASIGLLQMMVFTGLGMIAMTHVDSSRAVLLAYTTPLWGVIAGWMLFRDTPNKLQFLALIIGLLGIGLICSPWEMNWNVPGTLMGTCFLLIAAISWSLVILHIKHHTWTMTPLQLAPWQMVLATIPLIGFAYLLEGFPKNITYDSNLLALLIYIGPIATSACFVISAEHGRRISTFAMSNCTLGVPLIGIIASVFLLGNKLSILFVIGLGLILLGMLMASVATKRSA